MAERPSLFQTFCKFNDFFKGYGRVKGCMLTLEASERVWDFIRYSEHVDPVNVADV